MINSQRHIPAPAVLAPMSIAAQNVFPRKDDLFEGDTNVDRETDDAREGHRLRNGPQIPTIGRFDQLSFPEKQKDDSLFYVANA
jgi:hypothetical protein